MTRSPRPTHRRRPSRIPPTAALSARVERLYVACVAFALGVVGTAIGFTFGVVPYFRSADFSQYDWFFAMCVGVGAVLGFLIGVANGARWYRATEASPLIQRRMLAYLRRHGDDGGFVPQRTLNNVSLRALMGARRAPRV